MTTDLIVTDLTGWGKILHEAFYKVYLRKDEDTEDGDIYSPLHRSLRYKLSVFFGLPTTLGDNEELLTPKRMIKNFFGWPNEGQTYARMPFVFIWNSIKVLTLTIWQPVRFLTEFLPNLSVRYMVQSYKDEVSRQEKYHQTTNMRLRLGLRNFLIYLFYAVWIIGLATTSPLDSIIEMYARGHSSFRNSPYQPYISIAFAVFSILLTGAIYTACFPLAIQAIMTQFPVAATNLATFVITYCPGLVSASTGVISSAATILNSLEVFGAISMGLALLGNIGLRAIYYYTTRSAYTALKKEGSQGNTKKGTNGSVPNSVISIASEVILVEKPFESDGMVDTEEDRLAEQREKEQDQRNTPGLSLYATKPDIQRSTSPQTQDVPSVDAAGLIIT